MFFSFLLLSVFLSLILPAHAIPSDALEEVDDGLRAVLRKVATAKFGVPHGKTKGEIQVSKRPGAIRILASGHPGRTGGRSAVHVPLYAATNRGVAPFALAESRIAVHVRKVQVFSALLLAERAVVLAGYV